MKFTLEELITTLKYHGHTYNMSTLEILEGLIKDQAEMLEELELKHEKDTEQRISENLTVRNEDILEFMESLLENKTEDLKDDDLKDIKTAAMTEFYEAVKTMIDNYRD